MNAEIISCGTELLLGHKVNTNASYISNILSGIGLDVYRHNTIGDNRERLSACIKDAHARSNIVIITGGLGPTVDDITMGTLASVIQKDLVFNKGIYKYIKDRFKKHEFKVPKDALKQALIPRGAEWIQNDVGTAPGLIIKHDKKHIIALPGPPGELNPMLEKDIIPFLKKLNHNKERLIKSKSLKITGIIEAKVNEKVKGLLKLSGHTTVGIYTTVGEVELKITAKAHTEKKADAQIKTVERKIRKIFGKSVFGENGYTLQQGVADLLKKKKHSIAIAESCTGGRISDLITDIPGSSKYFLGSVTAYSDKIKISKLDIPKELIKEKGAVSKETAKAMAENVRNTFGSDIGLAVTGIAGPKGETKKKPIGLVYIALATKKKDVIKEFRFMGSRDDVKLQSTQQALNLIRLNI